MKDEMGDANRDSPERTFCFARRVVEVYRGENAKEKANTMRTYWVPGVNNLGRFGRWAFTEFNVVYEMEAEFDQLVNRIVEGEAQNV